MDYAWFLFSFKGRRAGLADHHVAEASFKAVGRALAQALTRDGSLVRSTKGSL